MHSDTHPGLRGDGVDGIGAGVMASGGAILAGTYTGPARPECAALGTSAGVGMAIGPTLSGWLVGVLGWRAYLAASGAIGLVLCAGALAIRETKAARLLYLGNGAAASSGRGAAPSAAAVSSASMTVGSSRVTTGHPTPYSPSHRTSMPGLA